MLILTISCFASIAAMYVRYSVDMVILRVCVCAPGLLVVRETIQLS